MSSYMQREQILLVCNIKIDAGGMEQEIIHMVADWKKFCYSGT